MYLYELQYRVNNGYCCFDRKVIVRADQLEDAKDRVLVILRERCGCGEKAIYSLLAHKKLDDNALFVELD